MEISPISQSCEQDYLFELSPQSLLTNLEESNSRPQLKLKQGRNNNKKSSPQRRTEQTAAKVNISSHPVICISAALNNFFSLRN